MMALDHLMRTCSIDGCSKPHYARGWCNKHYARWWSRGKQGDVASTMLNDDGAGTVRNGYRQFTMPDGTRKFEHVIVAERALGKSLPSSAQVHHVNGNRLDNRPENLVICPDDAYHKLLHRRQRALDACGHADWRACGYCGQYDDPSTMFVQGHRAEHRTCRSEYARKWRKRNAAR